MADLLCFLVERLLYFFDDVGLSGFLYDQLHCNNFKFVELGTYLTPCVC